LTAHNGIAMYTPNTVVRVGVTMPLWARLYEAILFKAGKILTAGLGHFGRQYCLKL